MREKTLRRAGLLCLVWLLLTAPIAAATGGSCALTVRYPCGGVTFRLYWVGKAGPEGRYTPTGDFASYSVSLTDLDAQGWAGAAETLDAYAARDGLEPLKTEVTNESGELTFSGLTPGLYLVTWPRHTTGGAVYTPQPFLVVLPGLTGDALTATPKYGKAPASGGVVLPNPPLAPRTAQGPAVTLQPESSSGPVTSPAPGAATRPELYSAPTAPADPSAVPGPSSPAGEIGPDAVLAPAGTSAPDGAGATAKPDGPKIPQTGQLWWPVSPLALAGLTLYLLGWRRARRADHGG